MKIIYIVLTGILFQSCLSKEPEVYQWKGKERKGIFSETDLLKSWPENGPVENWYLEGIGNGYGSPTITKNEIFITGEIDSMATLFCVSFEGEILWKSTFGDEWIKSYRGSRSAPTIVDNLVYIGSGMGNLFCLKRENGEVV